MLVVAPCAIQCGAENWVGIQIWAHGKLEWRRRFAPLCNGVPVTRHLRPGVRCA
ncbi:transposase family protein [Paraburkholderia sediminicola]|uniref:transposase family protein n=1 Tax=Paraburkholderia sediminicola TaxID=458836 RepID=UPI0038B919DE